ncbi:hypothetical protein ACFLU6_13610 [Acidobacteriota bacterium]
MTTMYESEKNWLEKIADNLPGIKGYRDKEQRRDTDKRLREYIADQIDGVRKDLSDIQSILAGEGKLPLLDDVDKLDRRLQQAADEIRFASYGYAGLFDAVKIREQELDEIYQYDAALLDVVDHLKLSLTKLDPSTVTMDDIKGFGGELKELEQKIAGRKQIFNTPV